jgi:hypothetical protein
MKKKKGDGVAGLVLFAVVFALLAAVGALVGDRSTVLWGLLGTIVITAVAIVLLNIPGARDDE